MPGNAQWNTRKKLSNNCCDWSLKYIPAYTSERNIVDKTVRMNVAEKKKIGSTDLLVGFKELRWWKSLGFERMWQCSDYRLHVTNVSWFLAITHPLSFSHHCVFFSLARLSLDFLSLICWKKNNQWCDSNLSVTCRLPFSSVQQWSSPLPDLLSLYYQMSSKKPNPLSLSVLSFSLVFYSSSLFNSSSPNMTWVKEHCSW